MRQKLSTGLLLAAAMTLALPGLVQAKKEKAAKAAAPSASASDPAPDNRWALGFGYLPARNLGGGNGALDALSASFRATRDLTIDGLLLGGMGSAYTGGTNNTGGAADDNFSNFGLGAQGRYSLAHPTDNLAFQVLGRMSYVVQSNTHTTNGHDNTTSSGQVGLFAGAGFEGFIPAWRNVSVEVNSGLNILFTGASFGGTGNNDAGVFLGASNANAFVPFNLALHYYF